MAMMKQGRVVKGEEAVQVAGDWAMQSEATPGVLRFTRQGWKLNKDNAIYFRIKHVWS
jgi:hypothetical protein